MTGVKKKRANKKSTQKSVTNQASQSASKSSKSSRTSNASELKTSSKKSAVGSATTSKKASLKSTSKTTGKVASQMNPRSAAVTEDRLLATRGVLVEDLRLVRFAGVSLGGGKTDKTAVAILEYYPDRKRVFLRSLSEKVSARGDVTADEALLEILLQEQPGLWCIAFDVPLQLPTCVRCDDPCPGAQSCNKPVMDWMRDMHRKRDKTKRPNKMFTPYTERAAEIYIANELEEPFHPPHALGSNAAPLAARAHCLKRSLSSSLVEVYPKLTLWRIGRALDIQKSHLRFHKHAVDSDETRLAILKTLVDKEIAFLYQQDMRAMVENNTAFEAFLCAMTAFLKYRGQTEKPPAGFPKGEIWIDFPLKDIRWF